jgi:hypothetical protein
MTQKTVKQYITVMSHSVEGVRIQVNENIEFGFQPLGGIAGGKLDETNVWVQAMVRYQD